MRLTTRGNLIKHNSNNSTPTAVITTIKTHWNSVKSTSKLQYVKLIIKDFYLNSTLMDYIYMRLPVEVIP